MQIALLGLANSGRTSLLNALSGLALPTHPYPSTEGEPHRAVVKVPDERVDALSRIYAPKKTTYATVEYVDPLGFIKGEPAQNQRVVGAVKDADAVMLVLRAFRDEGVLHPLDEVDPVRDFRVLEEELILTDLLLVETRLGRMEESSRKGRTVDETEKRALLRCREILESEQALRHTPMDEEMERGLQHLEFVSSKPALVVLNAGEEEVGKAASSEAAQALAGLLARFPEHNRPALEVCSAKIEMEIAQLPAEEAASFADDLGLSEPARTRLIQASYRLLGAISFLTVGDDEVRAWTVRSGTIARKAAGKVHSDIERGFIRAEVVSFEDFMRAGGDMAAVKKAAAARLEGKTYPVRDGDIINFRFNVGP